MNHPQERSKINLARHEAEHAELLRRQTAAGFISATEEEEVV